MRHAIITDLACYMWACIAAPRAGHVAWAPSLPAQVRDYLLALESHLSEAHRQAARLTAKEVEVGEATLEFGQVMTVLSRVLGA
jgi:hypothetical protein